MKYRNVFWIICLTALGSLAIYLAIPQRAEEQFVSPGAVFTVTTNADSGTGSLRQAIMDANASAGTDTIRFQIGTGAVSINIASDLPVITDPVIIDGTTQPGYSGTPLVTVFLSAFITPQGLKITGGGSTIKAIAVTNGMTAITLENGGGNVITGCYIGVCPQTAFCGNGANGILINNSPNNQIGGSTTTERNIIGGNTNDGIRITGGASSGNIIIGNYIGIAANGSAARNNDSGVSIIGAPNNRVGGAVPGERNVITNNSQVCDLPGTESNSGVLIFGAAASGNVVEGNYIGTTINGMNAPPGGDECNSVRIENAPNNRVGGTVGTTPGGDCTGACNVIAGVTYRGGVFITGSGATGNTILGNFIGTNAAGTAQLYNDAGVTITAGASNNTVGGTIAAARNLIADGLILTAGASGNIIQGNYIGTDTTGNVGIGLGTLFPNILVGVGIDSSANNRIGAVTGTTLGGACTGGCNLISGHISAHGVFITGAGSTGNRVDYNYIGLNAAGTAALRNGGDAITLRNGANNNIIGRLTTPDYQPTTPAPSTTFLIQDTLTGNFIEFDTITRRYKVANCRGGLLYTQIIPAEDVVQNGTVITGYYSDPFSYLRFSFDTATGKGSGSARMSNFTEPSEGLWFEIKDDSISNHLGDCPTEGMQIAVGTGTNGINNDPNPPNNNDYNTNSLGCSADGIDNLSSELADGNFICRTCNFTSFTNNSVCTRGENESFVVRGGADNFFSRFSVQHIRASLEVAFFRPIDLHDDNVTNPPVPNPGPGANRSQNSPQNVSVRLEAGGSVRLTGEFNSTPNKRFLISVYAVEEIPVLFTPSPPVVKVSDTNLTFEVMTDMNGNAVINQKYTGTDAFTLRYADDIVMTATIINQAPITSENSASSFVDVPGDTSEMSLPAAVPKPQFDFDGDGKTDFAVYRPGATINELSYWFVLNSHDLTFRIVQFGNGDDKPVAGDYQGDGVTDFAVFRQSNSTWYHSRLTGNPSTDFVGFQWGLSGDIPVPGDYDGDGANDAAVFRPSERIWYIRRSLDGSLLTNRFGLASDKLVPADYNGDGQTDFAIYRSGQWWTSPCAGCPASVINFGLPTDDPVPGVDFNGDGADDIAVTRSEGANKIWHWLESGTGAYRVVHFGLASDKVLVGDFDADGKSDLAVFRPSEGNWYVFGSEQGFFVLRWGTSGDIPVPSAHLP